MLQNIKFEKQDLSDLGELWAERIVNCRSARDELMKKTWQLALENYEGKAGPVDFPWPNSSNAHVPVTGTHCDAFMSRFYNAATAHDPVYLILPGAKEDLPKLDIDVNKFADAMQEISKWIEGSSLNHKETMEEVTTLIPKYGDAFVMVTWEHQMVADIDYNEDGEPGPPMPRDLIDRPVLRVLHPRNFYMPTADRDIQLTPWCAVDEDYVVGDMRMKGASGEWYPKQVDAVLNAHGERTKKEQRRAAKDDGWYRAMADGRMMNRDEFELEQMRLMRINEMGDDPGRIRLTRVFCRMDTDKDGIPEEVILLLDPVSKIVVQARWNHYQHRERPLVHFYFVMREGTWLSIGAAELLFNIQKILNDVMRDMLNNNQVKNTSIFIGKADGSLTDKTALYPSRLLLLKNPKEDFMTADLGSGTLSVSVQDLQILQGWAERRTGISDFNLGREKTSRTPATTLLTLLEEGNERIVRIIDRMKDAQATMWKYILSNYIQQGMAGILERILTPEQVIMVRKVWDQMKPMDVIKNLVVEPKVSTKTLNRAMMRQETMALFGQMEELYARLFSISQAFRQTDDPKMKELLIKMARGLHTLMRRVLNTYDEKDHRDINPDISEELEGLMSQTVEGVVENVETNPFEQTGRSNQVQQATGILANQGGAGQPANAPGRPAPGQPRISGQ